jgi:hypothetical protein
MAQTPLLEAPPLPMGPAFPPTHRWGCYPCLGHLTSTGQQNETEVPVLRQEPGPWQLLPSLFKGCPQTTPDWRALPLGGHIEGKGGLSQETVNLWMEEPGGG